MQMKKRLSLLLLSLLLCCCMGVTAYAHEVPDPSRTGSISVTMLYGQTAVPGGSLTLYRVGAIAQDDGNYSFTLTGDFAGCGKTLDDLESSELAASLADYAEKAGLKGKTVTIGEDGSAAAKGLELGLYLLVQKQAADGYEAAAPFLVSVPMEENGTYLYHVDASPKVGTLTQTEPEPNVPPNTPPDTKLPQTGQLNWPVPVMAVLGMFLFVVGWAMRYGKKRKPDEA